MTEQFIKEQKQLEERKQQLFDKLIAAAENASKQLVDKLVTDALRALEAYEFTLARKLAKEGLEHSQWIEQRLALQMIEFIAVMSSETITDEMLEVAYNC